MDWHREVLATLRTAGAGWRHDHLPWPALVELYRGLESAANAALGAALLDMIDLDYRNPHSEQPYRGDGFAVIGLPGGMTNEDLLCVEAAAFAAAALNLPGALPRLQALLRNPRFHAVYPHLRQLHLELPDLVRRLQPPARG